MIDVWEQYENEDMYCKELGANTGLTL